MRRAPSIAVWFQRPGEEMPREKTSTISQRGATSVGLSSIVAAASGLLVLFVATRALSPQDNATFIAFWSFLFALFGLLSGVQNETTRAVRNSLQAPDADQTGRPRALSSGLLVGALLAVAVVATSPAWAPTLFGDHAVALVAATCFGAVAFAGHCSLAGALSGLGRWESYSLLVGTEAAVRLGLVVVASAPATGLLGIQVASAVAAGIWLLLILVMPSLRTAASSRADVGLRTFAANVGRSMIASASSATIVVGFPIALLITSETSVYKASAPLLLAISLTRAPLLIPLASYQGVAITHFLENRHRGVAVLARTAGAVLAVAVVGAGLAAAAGPWIMRSVFGADYDVASAILASLTLAAGLLAVLTLTGAAVLALGHHTAYATGWVVASVVSIGVLLLPFAIETRAITSLMAGPLVGCVVHVVCIARASVQSR
ncbi:hypothetical protein [Sanguibacter sp. 25GB23B1]|uniref:lipopolysaccharide biosynthesis protein n=1 Tax=Sanguibacter sp. 25GB23B1 TaxID=3156067 RepID=UPI0032AED60B